MPKAWRERPMLELRGENYRRGDDNVFLCMSFNSVFQPFIAYYSYSVKLYVSPI